MPITVPCRKCKTKFQVPSKLAGQTVRCKSCGAMLKLPSPERIQAKKQPAASGGKAAPPPPPKRSAHKAAEEDLVALSLYEEPDGTKATAGRSPAPSSGPPDALMEPTVLSCGLCGGLLYYDPNFAGQTVACPHCGNHLIMPEL
jgi:ribosomal protein S27E